MSQELQEMPQEKGSQEIQEMPQEIQKDSQEIQEMPQEMQKDSQELQEMPQEIQKDSQDIQEMSQERQGMSQEMHEETTMASPSFKLNYFPLRGRVEIARLVLHAAGRQFEDNIVQFADWGALKPKSPFGSMPYLEVDGEAFGQGIAIATYLAKEVGLYASTTLDGLRIEQLQQLREDLITEEVNTWKEKDAAKKETMTKNMMENVYPKILAHFERLIKENQERNSSQYTVGDKLTLADIVILEGTQSLRQQNPALLDQYPAVKAVSTLVSEVEGVKAYLARRPVWDL